MRLFLLIFFCCSIVPSFSFLYSQPTWSFPLEPTLCSEECTFAPSQQLLINKDGNILVLNTKIIDSIEQAKQHISCFDNDGNFLWEQEYDFGVDEVLLGDVIGPFSRSIQELNTGELLATGRFRENGNELCYFLKMDSNGDSLIFRSSENFPYCTSGLKESNNSIFGGMKYSFSDNQFRLIEFDQDLNINSEVLLESSEDHGLMTIDNINSNVYLMDIIFGNISFKRYDFSGNLINEVNDYENLGRFMTTNNQGLLTAYDHDLVQFNEDLTEKWYLSFEEILPTWNPDNVLSKTIRCTSDGGFILGGDAYIDPIDFVFLAKINEDGSKDWGFVYDPFYLNIISSIQDVVQVGDGGYVILGRSYFSGHSWLIKVTEDGLLTSSTKEVSSKSSSAILFPNPTDNFLNIHFNEMFSGHIQLIDMSGKVLQEKDVNHSTGEVLHLQDLPNGLYWVRLMDLELGFTDGLKFVKCSLKK